MMKMVYVSVLFALLVASVSAFSPMQWSHALGQSSMRTVASRSPLLLSLANNSDDFPQEESAEYRGAVDWDAEWKKVVASGGTTTKVERPGKDFYKSEAEIAAIKVANKAAERVVKVGDTMKSNVPDVKSLTKDWKFWIGILVVLSVATSLLSAPQMGAPPISSGDSYYI